MLTREKYKMSFTSSSLRRRESAVIADLFLRLSDWDAVCNEILSQNILQLNTVRRKADEHRETLLIIKHHLFFLFIFYLKNSEMML